MWDFLSPRIPSSHPFSISFCHNVFQVGGHSGWTYCTMPSNSLNFYSFIDCPLYNKNELQRKKGEEKKTEQD